MKPRLNSLPALATFTMTLALAVTAAKAQTFNGSDTNWSTATAWTPNGVPAAGANITIQDATTNNTLLLDGATLRSIGSLTFGTTGTRRANFAVHTQAGNSLTIAGGIVANGTFDGSPQALSMRGNFVISADQTWSSGTLTSPNNDQGIFFRETTIPAVSRGTLALNANVTKAGAGQVIFGSTDVTGAGNVIVNAGWLKVNAGSSLLVNVGGTGNLTFNNATTFGVYRNSGTMTITRPVLMNGTSTLLTSNGTVDIASPVAFNGTHNLNVASTTNLTGAITGAGTINRIGTGALSINNTVSGFTGTLNLTTGVTTIQQNAFGGSIAVSSGATLIGETKTSGSLALNGSGFSADASTAGSLGSLGALSLTGTNTVTLASPPTSTAPFTVLTYGTLTGGAANLALAGAANYRSAVFDSTTTPGVITLAIGSDSRTWNATVDNKWDINTTANWLGGDQKFFQLDNVSFGNTGAGTVAITGVVTPSSITVNSTADYEFTAAAGNLIGGSGSLTKSGSGVLTLGGANTFTGAVAINSGVIKLNANTALGGNGKAVTIASGATLDTNGVLTTNSGYALSIAGSGVGGLGAVVNNSLVNNTFGFGSATLTANATVGGTGRFDLVRPTVAPNGLLNLAGFTLDKIGPNQVGIIDSTVSAPGTINVNEGIVSFTRSTVSGAGPVNVGLLGVLLFENNTTGSFSKDIVVEDGIVRTSGNAFTISSATTLTNFPYFQTTVDLTITGPVGGTGTLTKAGVAALILSGAVTHAGDTIVNEGTLQFGAGGTTGSIAKDILTFGGTVAFNRSDAISYGNVISGPAALTKLGAGTLTLTAAQAYTGNTNVNAGTLIPGGSNFVPTASLLNFANTAGATFDMSGQSHEVRAIGGGGATGGSVINSGGGTQTLTVRPTLGDTATYAGNILGGIRFVVAGNKIAPSGVAPRQRLDGTVNTYTGGTLVDGGTLLARTDGSLGAVPASFDNDNIILQNNGMMFNEAEGVALDISANRGILIGPGCGGLSGGFNSAGVTVRGVISGAAGNPLTVTANNSNLTFTTDNTYAGDTIIQPLGAEPSQPTFFGRLVIGNGGTTGNHGAGNVINDGQLTFMRSDNFTETGVISGVGLLRQQGAGNLVLSAINTYSGNTEVLTGTLTLADNAGMKFLVTDAASNKVTGPAAAVFNGDFTIDTSAVTVTTGSWTLVDVGTLTETFGSTFTVAGGWTESSNVWTKSGGGVTWSFTEATGVLSVAPGGATTYASWIGGFDFSAFPGANLSAAGDADGDGIRNAVEMVLGNLPNQTKVENLPTISLVTNPAGVPAGDYFKLSYRRTTLSVDAGLVPEGQYDVDLAGTWTSAVDGNAGVEVIETANALIPGSDVDVYIPRSLAASGKLFGRLSVLVP